MPGRFQQSYRNPPQKHTDGLPTTRRDRTAARGNTQWFLRFNVPKYGGEQARAWETQRPYLEFACRSQRHAKNERNVQGDKGWTGQPQEASCDSGRKDDISLGLQSLWKTVEGRLQSLSILWGRNRHQTGGGYLWAKFFPIETSWSRRWRRRRPRAASIGTVTSAKKRDKSQYQRSALNAKRLWSACWTSLTLHLQLQKSKSGTDLIDIARSGSLNESARKYSCCHGKGLFLRF